MIRLRLLVAVLLIAAAALPASAQTTVATGVSEDATEAASEPKIARDARGGIHLAFVKPSPGFDQIHVASSTDGGRTWRLRQVTTRAVHSRYPTLAAGPDGDLHLAWTQYEPIGHVYYARFDGQRWSTPVKLSPGNTYAGVPAIAVDPQGESHIVWYGIRAEAPQVRTRHGSIYEIMYTGLARGRWSSPIVISPGIPDSINPALAVDSSGALHSAWYQFDMQTYQVRYARRVRGWEPPQQVSSGRADAFAVALAVRDDGTAYVAWERRQADSIRIFFAERGARWSGQEPVSPEGQNGFNPTVAVDERGRIFVVWESDGQLYLRRRDRQWLGTERIASEGKNTHPILASHEGSVDLMWTQEVAGERRVRFVTLGAPGEASPRAGPFGWLILLALAIMLLWYWSRRSRAART